MEERIVFVPLVLVVTKIIRPIREGLFAIVAQIAAHFFTIADSAIMSVERKILSRIGLMKNVMTMRAVRKHTEFQERSPCQRNFEQKKGPHEGGPVLNF